MKATERAFNYALGLSVLSWSLLGLLQPLCPTRVAISALNAVVGVLLIVRSPLVRSGSIKAICFALPGVVVAGIALKLTAPLESWTWIAQALFCAGVALTIAAFLWLGKSFAILPALRTIVSNGPYRLIRHPAYAGELMMVSACVVAEPTLYTAAALVVAIPLVLLRIVVEERLLGGDTMYTEYTETVRYRLVPSLW